ncbi:MAG: putative zinc-binding protein [Methanomassiliicoccales archaeon]|nr:putative zinc-binding protein [Methanomassiliicoccales archaeon]
MTTERPKCSCNGGSTGLLIYSCAGSSNVGQLANEVAIEMARSGKGSMGCLIGLGAHVSTMVQNAKAANRIMMIDGCGVRCGMKALEHIGLTNFDSVVITEMGIKKNCDLKGDRDKLPELVKLISGRAGTITPLIIGEERVDGGCGCGTEGCCTDHDEEKGEGAKK